MVYNSIIDKLQVPYYLLSYDGLPYLGQLVTIITMKDTRWLCSRCANDYREAGYKLKFIYTPTKDVCDFCCIGSAFLFEVINETDNTRSRKQRY